ncbi:hypothetical protein [Pleionea sp. CnH1-48]|uniref:hypothetical protein n=1 Tax=Pleionea sp. CnH1-48 TaxID=2954494 RepID=UPI0020983E1F|nr:hypothetical protein [Pleionea sp. CnH1-48]MCO7223688.1 hypothetical protein [Pleionea sp. CnH1-48]
MEITLFIGVLAITGSILGALVGGIFSFIATRRLYASQILLDKENQSVEVNNILDSLYDEINALVKLYKKNIGNQIKKHPSNQVFDHYFFAKSDYFTVYESNATLLAKLSDPELKKLIIETYLWFKSVIDTLELNNERMAKFEEARDLFIQTGDQRYQLLEDEYYKTLLKLASNIKENHQNAMKSSESMLDAIEEYREETNE